MKELQPEIWAHIFQFLYRPPPPAWDAAAWEVLHQHDLTTISRLSSTHHELAVPLLYTSIVIDGLPSLLAHLDDAGPSLIAKITPKRDRLALTQHIRIAAPPPPYEAWTLHQLLSEDVTWTRIGETPQSKCRRWYKEARTTLEGIRQVLPDFRNGTKAPLHTPRLDSVVIARDTTGTWRKIFSPRATTLVLPIPPGLTQLSAFTRAWVEDFILTLNPKILCSHRCDGPYDPWGTEVPEGKKMVRICQHFHGDFGVTLPSVMNGVTNRYYLEPPFSSPIYHEDMTGEGLDTLFNILKGFTERPSTARIKIELWGLLTQMSTREAYIADETQDRNGTTRSEREQYAAEEREAVESLRPHIREALEPVWQGKFDIGIWYEIPKCEGCGWTNMDM